MSFNIRLSIFIFFFLLTLTEVLGQSLNLNLPIINEYIRREQLNSNISPDLSGVNRPFNLNSLNSFFSKNDSTNIWLEEKEGFSFTPIVTKILYNSRRPYGWGFGIAQPGVGFQYYQSLGVSYNLKWLSFQFAPEFLINQNKPFEGFSENFSERIIRERFFYWNNGDFPEKFGNGTISKAWFGQSSLLIKLKKLAIGISTENIWWGPGQFNSLSYSDNAQGFFHLKFQTQEPLKTPIGNFEFNLLSGRIDDSGLNPTQSESMNEMFFRQFSGDWKYMNSLLLSYNPKWVKGLHLGFIRTNQQYSEFLDGSLSDIFPVFNPFQKVNFGFDRDDEGRDQQVILFGKLIVQRAKAELYFEYGRRDHAFNWREAILNPEHARAFLFGFNKLFDIPNPSYTVQIRGEMVHQQESVNRYIRYPGLRGNQTWHTHSRARGFTNLGQPLGVGAGVGSNVQSLEVSFVDGFNKKGILFERLENHQDFFYRAFGQQQEVKPWIDLSIGFLFDHQWKNFILSSKFQMINANNYQWNLAENSTSDFSRGQSVFSIYSQIHLIYLLQSR